MARKDFRMEELVEVLHQWHSGRSISQIKRSVWIDRKTIRKYVDLALGHGFSRDMEVQPYQYYLELAGKIQRGLKAPLDSSPAYRKTALYQTTIDKLLAKPYMTPKQAYRLLLKNYDYKLSYSSFTRYMNIKYPKQIDSCLRIEVGTAEEGQVDFGSAGLMYDPETKKMRRAHAFVLTLSYSRFFYVEFVFDQGQVTWVRCHMNAFEFFGGVPKRIVLDNLKSGVLRPNTYDPVFNKAYAECGKHYGFIIDPAKAYMAAHKGKVERRVPVVREQFVSSYEVKDIADANRQVREWCMSGYGMQIHGTIKRKPYDVFKEEEQKHLLGIPAEGFEIPLWKEAKVHRDHHIVFDKSYYSMPTRYVGKKVWCRGGFDTVRIFYDGELTKTHQRSYRAGTFRTDEGDYPPEKSRYLLKTLSYYQQEAAKHGVHVCELITKVMEEHAYRNLRKVQGIFRLADKYGAEALDLTCRRCLFFDDDRMSTIKRILDKGLYNLPLSEEITGVINVNSGDKTSFVRPAEYFMHAAEGIQ